MMSKMDNRDYCKSSVLSTGANPDMFQEHFFGALPTDPGEWLMRVKYCIVN